jgi:transposase
MNGEKRYIKLDEVARQELENGRKNGKKAIFRERCHYILLSNENYLTAAISKIYNRRYMSILGWLKRYEAEGIQGLHTKKGQGSKPIIKIENELQEQKVTEIIESHPQNVQNLRAELEAEFGKMSQKTVIRFLKKKICLETT